MKSLGIMIVLLCTAFFSFAQQEIVSGKTKLNIEFQNYKTFTWSQTASANELIKTSVQQELQARGYQPADVNADLIISYQILEKRTNVKGYNNDSPTVVGSEEIREPQDTVTYTLEPGTLMISMIDRKTSEVVWDGFASGISKPNTFATKPDKVKAIVAKIFGEFKHRATPLEN